MGEMGLFGGKLPEKYGGSGLDCVTAGIIVEEITRGDFNEGYMPLLPPLNGQIIVQHASPALTREWLGAGTDGQSIVCIVLAEPSGGFDAASLRMKAERKDGTYVLNGEVTSISMADQADVAVVFARTGAQEFRANGISAFLVPMTLPRIKSPRVEDAGQRAIGRGSTFFASVQVHVSHRLGYEGKGFKQVMQCLAIAQ